MAALTQQAAHALHVNNAANDLPDVEQVAMERRLDVQAAKLDTEALAKNLGLTKTTRFINALEFGPARVLEGQRSDPYKRGYEISLELPIFDWGGAKVEKAEALYMQAVYRTAETAINARSEVRESYRTYRSSFDIAKHYRDEIVPVRMALGNTALMAQFGVPIEALKLQAEALRADGASVMVLAIGGQPAGLLAVSDPVKSTTAEALGALKSAGIRVVMATGDGLTTAKAVAAKLGIEEVHGEVKPADKLVLVDKLQKEGRIVAMAGDGINDAPALAKADVGVAMGTGTDVAMNSAQVTLVKGDLQGIAQARTISQETIANMKQNLGFAFIYNALGVPLAAGVLFPFTGWLLSPMIAALAMSLSSFSVISNALRLRGK